MICVGSQSGFHQYNPIQQWSLQQFQICLHYSHFDRYCNPSCPAQLKRERIRGRYRRINPRIPKEFATSKLTFIGLLVLEYPSLPIQFERVTSSPEKLHTYSCANHHSIQIAVRRSTLIDLFHC